FAVNSVDVIALETHLARQGRADWQLERPFLSANDRSRWATVRALVEHGTYAIDEVTAERGWDTIDMVKHVGPDGKEHLYSSKPPLFATLMAGEYWLIHKLTGATLADHPYEVGRFMLVTINVLPLLVYFWLLARLAERFGTTDWGRLFMMAAAAFGTFLTTFAVSINNHLPAAVCVVIACYCCARIWYDGELRTRYFALAGWFAALAVTNELPALSLFALVAAALLWRAPRETLIAFVPAALVVAAAAFGTNYLAHGDLRPPYMHRSQSDASDNWYDYSYERGGKMRDSYWRNPAGIDQGEPSVATYALHATIGHHGVFSLTPIWILSVAGLFYLWRNGRREVALLIGSLSLVCLVFYLTRPQMDRNYGGMTSGFRWMFWFAPLWLVALLPTVDRMAASLWGRGVALVLLMWSVMSATYPTWNPWTHPWLWNFLEHFGTTP
ncbi:MAG TPA: glycosyltransferase 87 family protein, partial [Pirellulales bacterium]|nr:glycosyltransferase 87 family protein [Pirellulales bacterium]